MQIYLFKWLINGSSPLGLAQWPALHPAPIKYMHHSIKYIRIVMKYLLRFKQIYSYFYEKYTSFNTFAF